MIGDGGARPATPRTALLEPRRNPLTSRSPRQGLGGESEYFPSGVNISGTLVKEAELVIPPPIDAARLLRFTYQIEETLEATIVQQVGSWDKGTIITIQLRKASPLANILDRLREMPDVADIKEQSATKRSPFDFPQKSIAKLRIRPKKKVLVTLKQTGVAKQSESAGLKAS